MERKEVELSIVIPVYNEEGNIKKLYNALDKIIHDLMVTYEIIFVNDGSMDRSVDEIERLCYLNQNVKLVSLSRNFGHQAALTAGLNHVSGKAVIMMDGDLQHPPEIIPELVKKWREGYDIVYTVRRYTAANAGLFKKWSSVLFYWFINKMSRITIPVGAADFRLINRTVVDELRKIKEQSPFFRGLISWVGFRQIGISYYATSRLSGTSSYSLRRMIRFALDGITSFSSFPLRIAMYMGFLVSGISFIYGIYTLIIGIFSLYAVSGWTSLMIMVLFLGGVQLITLGILGEYIGRIYDQVKGRPVYVVQKTVGDFNGLER